MGDRDYGDSISNKLTYFLVGAGIGAVLALLFAPKSGEELRSDIADATRKGIDRSKEAAQQIGAKAGEYYDATRQKAGELYDTARETAGEYYEATRERAADLYDTASAKAGDVVTKTKDAVSSQAGSISAARCSSRSSSPPWTRWPSCHPHSSSPRTAPDGAPSTASPRASRTRSS